MKKTIAATLASAVIGSLAMGTVFADDDTRATDSNRSTDSARHDGSERSAGQVVDDASIVARVKSGLLSSSEVEGLDVNVDARNGVVTLSGTADTMSERSSAERIAKSADGVKSVDNKIVVKPDASGSSDAGRPNSPRPAGPVTAPADPSSTD